MRRVVLFLVLSVFTAVEAVENFPGLTDARLLASHHFIHFGKRRLYETQVFGHGTHGDFRRLLNRAGDCEWDEKSKLCSISIPALIKIVKKSDSAASKVLLEELRCEQQSNKASCNEAEECLWSDKSKECSFLDISANHRSSPCAKAAPKFFEIQQGATLCSKIEGKKQCSKSKICKWIDRRGCALDFYFILFHIKKYSEKTSKIAQVMSQEKSDKLKEDPILLAKNFTWDSLLDWKPPSVTCPSKKDKTICQTVESYLDVYMPVLYYCRGKYTSYQSCMSDALCTMNFYGICVPSPSIEQKASEASSKILLALVHDDGPDKQYAKAELDCPDVASGKDCTGYCMWNPIRYVCETNIVSLFKNIISTAGDTEDAFCAFLNITASTGCEGISTRDDCNQTEDCAWDATKGCYTPFEVTIAQSLKKSPVVATQYSKVLKQCTEHRKKKKCTPHELWTQTTNYVY